MRFSLKKLRKAIKGTDTTETFAADSYIQAIINDVEGTPFGLSDSNVMYAGLSELAGYHYFKSIIIGTFKLKTFKGATLIVSGKDFQLTLASDMLELASEAAKDNRNITRIDFEIDEKDIPKLSRARIDRVELIAKKDKIVFSIVESSDEEEWFIAAINKAEMVIVEKRLTFKFSNVEL